MFSKRTMFLVSIQLLSLLSVGTRVFPQQIGFQGQFSPWFILPAGNISESQAGLRYLPELFLRKQITSNYTFDANFSINTLCTATFRGSGNVKTGGQLKPYRMWLRFSSSQFEARLGLQQINFGSATLLRPLMWFDRIDPRDPLMLTDGVYALLLRYYFLNNANLWMWGLYGNGEKRGWEALPSDKKKIEYGGRIQVPLLNGEMAFTYHHRQIDLTKQGFAALLSSENGVPENRYGLDGKWDIGIGIWFEAVLFHQNLDVSPLRYQRLFTAGLDYTFSFGNGLHVLGEHFIFETSEKLFGPGEKRSFSALSFNYSLGLLDRVAVMVYHDWKNGDWYRFINFQRTLDQWSFYLIGFWNPEKFQIYQNLTEGNLFAGKGVQFMVVLNY